MTAEGGTSHCVWGRLTATPCIVRIRKNNRWAPNCYTGNEVQFKLSLPSETEWSASSQDQFLSWFWEKNMFFKKLVVSNCKGIPMGSCLPLQVFKDEKIVEIRTMRKARQVGRISTKPTWNGETVKFVNKSYGLQWQHFRYRHKCLTCVQTQKCTNKYQRILLTVSQHMAFFFPVLFGTKQRIL